MLVPKKILIATNNKGKFSEIKTLLNQINIEAIPSFQFNIKEPKETGSSFAENSLLKAKFYAKKTGIFSLADDSGLCVEALNGAPGIHSARFAIDKNGEKNFDLAFAKIFSELSKINSNQDLHKTRFFEGFLGSSICEKVSLLKRRCSRANWTNEKITKKAWNCVSPAEQKIAAYFICNLSLFDPQKNFQISFEGRVDGNLTFPPRGNKGFGYDPIFIKNGMDKTFGEIDSEIKDKISHRADAFNKLKTWIKNPNL